LLSATKIALRHQKRVTILVVSQKVTVTFENCVTAKPNGDTILPLPIKDPAISRFFPHLFSYCYSAKFFPETLSHEIHLLSIKSSSYQHFPTQSSSLNQFPTSHYLFHQNLTFSSHNHGTKEPNQSSQRKESRNQPTL